MTTTAPDLYGWLIPWVVVGPLLAAALCLVVSRRPRVQNLITVVTLTGLVVVSYVLLLLTDRHGAHSIQVGGWDAPVGITLTVDRLSAMMLLVSAVVLLAVILFATGQGIRDGDDEQPVSIFLPTYLALVAGLADAFVAGDLFNLFVGFEILLAASYVLLTLGASAERVRAGVSYTVVSMVSSLVFLTGIALTYAATGSLALTEVASRMEAVPDGLRNTIYAVFLVAFGIKAAIFPLSTWLPDSYPTAPAPVTAVFAGLLTKVGVYAIIRFHTLVFPGGAMDRVLMVAAGSSDPRAGDDCEGVAGLLADELHHPVTTAYLSAAAPSLPEALAAARAEIARGGAAAASGSGAPEAPGPGNPADDAAGRVLLAPYLLAPGYFHGRVLAAAADVAAQPLLVADGEVPPELVDLVVEHYREAAASA